VGREAECTHLHAWLEQAQRGIRQVGFITGEVGISKTTVVDAFLAQVASEPGLWLARGQCIDHYGAGEPYLPVLQALGQLCRGPGGEGLVAELTQHAPCWLMQMPGLLSATALEAVQRRTLGATRERMLRNLAEMVEALTVERLLVLVLEDLHWSDTATLDLVAYLARRREPARFLLLGTYRPGDVIVREHPLRALTLDLQLHGQCVALPLERLTTAHVTEYLAGRFGAGADLHALASALHRRTDGHPLFLVTVVDALVRQGALQEVRGRWELAQELSALVEEGVPESLRQLIALQLTALSPVDQRVVEAASVAGMTCTVAAVAAGVVAADEAIEARCADLARQEQFLQAQGVQEWPDGTVTGQYGFRHILYQQVIYEQLPVARCQQLHQRLGARLEAGYRVHAVERAAELAVHFERGGDLTRAAWYGQQAATNALRRAAYAEALTHLHCAIALLQKLPDTPAHRQQELECSLTLGLVLTATHGAAAPEVGQTYARAQALCAQNGTLVQHFRVLEGLRRFSEGRGEFQRAQELGAQSLCVAQRINAPVLLVQAYAGLGMSTFFLGEFSMAQAHLAQGLRYYDAQQHLHHASQYGQDPGVLCHTHRALIHWLLGYPDQAVAAMQQALALAQALEYPASRGWALGHAAVLHIMRRDVPAVQAHVEAMLTLTALAVSKPLLQGWVLAVQGQDDTGLTQLRQGLAAWRATGLEPGRLFFQVLMAERYGHAGQAKTGLHLLAELLANPASHGQRVWEAELYRVQGTLLWATAQPTEAESWLQQALAIARHQGAKSLELRAAMSLARLWQQQGKCAAARALLAEVYGWFTEGFDTADLQEAKVLLTALS
jgi:predicted ATPase